MLKRDCELSGVITVTEVVQAVMPTHKHTPEHHDNVPDRSRSKSNGFVMFGV